MTVFESTKFLHIAEKITKNHHLSWNQKMEYVNIWVTYGTEGYVWQILSDGDSMAKRLFALAVFLPVCSSSGSVCLFTRMPLVIKETLV